MKKNELTEFLQRQNEFLQGRPDEALASVNSHTLSNEKLQTTNEKPNYMVGYCAFWNVEGCDWLRDSLPVIRNGVTSNAALKIAAHICARIVANIAVGREVKHFPRFYLCKNLE